MLTARAAPYLSSRDAISGITDCAITGTTTSMRTASSTSRFTSPVFST